MAGWLVYMLLADAREQKWARDEEPLVCEVNSVDCQAFEGPQLEKYQSSYRLQEKQDSDLVSNYL